MPGTEPTDVVRLKGHYEAEGARFNKFIDVGFGGLIKLVNLREDEVAEFNEKKNRLKASCRTETQKWLDDSQPEDKGLWPF